MTENAGVAQPARERHALLIAFWLNVCLAGSLLLTGIIGDSSGLIANALDNASDAAVYVISFYAVTRGPLWKIRAARVSGVMLLVLCGTVIADVVRRFISGAEPVSAVMIAMTAVAVIVNVVSLRVLRDLDRKDVNLRATWTFSINDVLSNLGVLVAGILVARLHRAWPDLVVGLAIAALAAKGGAEILLDARRTAKTALGGEGLSS